MHRITNDNLQKVKEEIILFNSVKKYSCTCGINPRFLLINKLCPKHFERLKELEC